MNQPDIMIMFAHNSAKRTVRVELPETAFGGLVVMGAALRAMRNPDEVDKLLWQTYEREIPVGVWKLIDSVIDALNDAASRFGLGYDVSSAQTKEVFEQMMAEILKEIGPDELRQALSELEEDGASSEFLDWARARANLS